MEQGWIFIGKLGDPLWSQPDFNCGEKVLRLEWFEYFIVIAMYLTSSVRLLTWV
jgi:hypothetical protein